MDIRRTWRCCKGSACCPLDNLAHRFHINWRWLCDRHDRRILSGT